MEDDNDEKNRHVTFRASDRLMREIGEWSERRGYSRSEAARKLIKQGLDYEDSIGEIEERINELEEKVQNIENRTSELESRKGETLGMDSITGAARKNKRDQKDFNSGDGP